MPLKPQVEGFFTELLRNNTTLTPEQKAAIDGIKKVAEEVPTVGDYLGRTVSGVSDLTRRSQEIQKMQADIKAQEALVQRAQQEASRYRDSIGSEYEKAANIAKKATEKLATLKGKAEAIAQSGVGELSLEDFNFSFDSLNTSTVPSVNTPSVNTPPSQGNSNYLSQDEALKFGQQTIAGVAELMTLAGEHQELFGSRLNISELMSMATSEGRSVFDVYKGVYNPDAKKAELQQKQIEAEIEKRAAERFAEMTKNLPMNSPNPLNPQQGSLIADMFFKGEFTPNKANGSPNGNGTFNEGQTTHDTAHSSIINDNATVNEALQFLSTLRS